MQASIAQTLTISLQALKALQKTVEANPHLQNIYVLECQGVYISVSEEGQPTAGGLVTSDRFTLEQALEWAMQVVNGNGKAPTPVALPEALAKEIDQVQTLLDLVSK